MLGAQLVLTRLAARFYAFVARATAEQDQDGSAGSWARDWLDAHGLGERITIVASEREGVGDSYWPTHALVHLTTATHADKGTGGWAVAAHELGHALLYRWLGPLRSLLVAFRLGGFLTGLAGAMMFTNLWLADAEVSRAAWWVLVVGLGARVGLLLDEAGASTIALTLLARDPRVRREGLRRAAWRLLGAFGTYFGAFVGAALLLWRWEQVAALCSMGVAPELVPLSAGWVWAAKALAALTLLVVAARVSVNLLSDEDAPTFAGCGGILQYLPAMPLLALTYRALPGKLAALVVALAVAPIVEVSIGLGLGLTLLILFGLAIALRLDHVLDWVLAIDAEARSERPRKQAREVGGEALDSMLTGLKQRPPLLLRLHAVRTSLLLVPLCVAVLLT